MTQSELRAAIEDAARKDHNADFRRFVLMLRARGWERPDEFYWIR